MSNKAITKSTQNPTIKAQGTVIIRLVRHTFVDNRTKRA